MKKITQKLMFSMLVALLITVQTKAQWITSGYSSNYFAQPDNTSISSGWTRSIGIGYFNTANAYPNSFLHINSDGMALPSNNSIASYGEVFRTNCPSSTESNWKMLIGGNQQGRLFNLGSDNNFQLEASINDLLFNAGGASEKMRIVGTTRTQAAIQILSATTINAGNVGIGNPNPLTMLHIGGINGIGSGYRTWMNIGTFYGSSEGYDNMYIGLKNVPDDYGDINNAIISWGNNPMGREYDIADRLLFLFTAHSGNGQASEDDGLETARITVNVDHETLDNTVRMGIGGDPGINVYSHGTEDPANTVEINSPANSVDNPMPDVITNTSTG